MRTPTEPLAARPGVTVARSLAIPYARALLLFEGGMAPLFLLLLLYLGPRESIPFIESVAIVFGGIAMMAALAGLFVSTPCISVTVTDDGVSAEKPAARVGSVIHYFIHWSDFSDKIVYSPYTGLVALIATDATRVISLTTAQAEVVLGNPRCPIHSLPPKLARMMNRI